jgi:hypothetical protein
VGQRRVRPAQRQRDDQLRRRADVPQGVGDVLCRIVECVGANEGTAFDGDWADYGVTPEQRQAICAEVERRDAMKPKPTWIANLPKAAEK